MTSLLQTGVLHVQWLKNTNGKLIVHMRALEIINLMLGSATVDAAIRSIRECDQVLQFLC